MSSSDGSCGLLFIQPSVCSIHAMVISKMNTSPPLALDVTLRFGAEKHKLARQDCFWADAVDKGSLRQENSGVS
jgi:hypothetical protein